MKHNYFQAKIMPESMPLLKQMTILLSGGRISQVMGFFTYKLNGLIMA